MNVYPQSLCLSPALHVFKHWALRRKLERFSNVTVRKSHLESFLTHSSGSYPWYFWFRTSSQVMLMWKPHFENTVWGNSNVSSRGSSHKRTVFCGHSVGAVVQVAISVWERTCTCFSYLTFNPVARLLSLQNSAKHCFDACELVELDFLASILNLPSGTVKPGCVGHTRLCEIYTNSFQW